MTMEVQQNCIVSAMEGEAHYHHSCDDSDGNLHRTRDGGTAELLHSFGVDRVSSWRL